MIIHTETYKGLTIKIKAVALGQPKISEELGLQNIWLCGYVKAPQELSTLRYSHHLLENISVYGGLTFAGKLKNENDWYFGFDCNHLNDQTNPKDFTFVLNQCKQLADQLLKVTPPLIFKDLGDTTLRIYRKSTELGYIDGTNKNVVVYTEPLTKSEMQQIIDRIQ